MSTDVSYQSDSFEPVTCRETDRDTGPGAGLERWARRIHQQAQGVMTHAQRELDNGMRTFCRRASDHAASHPGRRIKEALQSILELVRALRLKRDIRYRRPEGEPVDLSMIQRVQWTLEQWEGRLCEGRSRVDTLSRYWDEGRETPWLPDTMDADQRLASWLEGVKGIRTVWSRQWPEEPSLFGQGPPSWGGPIDFDYLKPDPVDVLEGDSFDVTYHVDTSFERRSYIQQFKAECDGDWNEYTLDNLLGMIAEWSQRDPSDHETGFIPQSLVVFRLTNTACNANTRHVVTFVLESQASYEASSGWSSVPLEFKVKWRASGSYALFEHPMAPDYNPSYRNIPILHRKKAVEVVQDVILEVLDENALIEEDPETWSRSTHPAVQGSWQREKPRSTKHLKPSPTGLDELPCINVER